MLKKNENTQNETTTNVLTSNGGWGENKEKIRTTCTRVLVRPLLRADDGGLPLDFLLPLVSDGSGLLGDGGSVGILESESSAASTLLMESVVSMSTFGIS